MSYDYSKLLGKIKERGFTQDTLSRKVGISASSFNLKLNNKASFKQSEIRAMCDILGVTDVEVGQYFFTLKV